MDVEHSPFDLVGPSEGFQRVLKLAAVLAKTRRHALLLGERGIGKERIARQIHQQSHEWNQPFVVVPCHELSEQQLLHLFCDSGSSNVLQQAHLGTLYLEEPQHLPRAAQEALLFALLSKTLSSQDHENTAPSDIRVFSAMRHEQEEHVRQVLLPELYYRLKEFLLEIPPLRERSQDVAALAQTFVQQFGMQTGRSKHLSNAVIHTLTQQAWPENTHELKNVIYRACEQTSESEISENSLPPEYQTDHEASISLDEISDLEELERRVYAHVFKRCGGDPKKAAEKLGIGLSTFYRKMRQYGLTK